jgi:GR25 family glycosyltransferase involved in LPS biosynthesis
LKFKIIRLKDNALSERIANESIAQAKLFNIDVELFDAINGLDQAEHLEKLNIKPLGKFKKGRPGVVGCFLSHYYLWLDCIKDNEPYLILEHDGYFIKPLPNNILDLFDDVMKLDSGNPYKDFYEQWLTDHANDIPSTWVIEDRDGGGGNHETGAGWNTIGAYAYIIKPTAAEKIVAWIKEHGFLPVDHLIGTRIVTISHYAPTIARLHPFYAIEGNIKAMSMTMKTELL